MSRLSFPVNVGHQFVQFYIEGYLSLECPAVLLQRRKSLLTVL